MAMENPPSMEDLIGKLLINGPCSFAMFDYRRVEMDFNGDEMGLNGKPGRPMEVFHGFSMVSIWFYRL